MFAYTVGAEEFAAIREQVRHFVRSRVVPREQEIADTDAIPDDIRGQAAAMGLFGYAIPAEYGGLGLDITQDVELAFEFGYTTLAFRSMFGTNNGIAGQVLVGFGTEEQKRHWLPRIASGEVVAAFALTEPEAGSDPSGLTTKAVRDGDGWVIDGAKRFITNGPIARLFMVFARVRPADEAGSGIAVFLVPADTPGVSVGPKDRKMGQEGAWTAPSAAKLFCTEAAGRVADLAVQVHGGSGYMRGVPVERIYRDARLKRLYEGTSEIQKVIIGRELLRAART
ncbi:MAG: acyl-CoA dehydrogenase family protein [Thermobispora bispora]|nr:acyl-CoA dehydrogenase family protein [Thermobispora bispora]